MKIKLILSLGFITFILLFIYFFNRDTSSIEPLINIPVIKLEDDFYMKYNGYGQNQFCYFIDESMQDDIKSKSFQVNKYIGNEIATVKETLDDTISDCKIYNLNLDGVEEGSIICIDTNTVYNPKYPEYVTYMKVKDFKYKELYDTNKWDDFLTSYSEEQNKGKR